MLRTPADIAFSKCIRERADWCCERCGTRYQPSDGGLECSHGHTRGKWAVRFCGLNAEALCTGCHFREGGLHRIKAKLTEWEAGRLVEMANDPGLGKLIRATKGKGEIAKHYRDEYARMRALRNDGAQGRIEFEDWMP